jgi:ATP-dependent RNA helicase RhlE
MPMKFNEFDIDSRCLHVLGEMEIETPTPVQEKAIPVALSGSDVIATAQTGTGKTLAFALPALTRLAEAPRKRNRLLVLVPTRELCNQVETVMRRFAHVLKMQTVLIHGGVGYRKQTLRLKKGCDIIVATPGRLLDHMGRGNIRFNNLEILIFDEADRMLDMGFLPDIQRIVARLPAERQTLMFSATFGNELNHLVSQLMRSPERIEVGMVSLPVESVRQVLYPVRDDAKPRKLVDLLKEEDIDSAIVFLRTKARTDMLGSILEKAGYKSVIIHGDLPQNKRQRALKGFREGRYNILAATDVAARGLDIDDVSHVINYDIPENADDYIHRIGRTARAEKEGDAITFVTPTEHSELGNIERALGKQLPRKDYEGAPPILSTWQPQTRKSGRGRRTLRRRRR